MRYGISPMAHIIDAWQMVEKLSKYYQDAFEWRTAITERVKIAMDKQAVVIFFKELGMEFTANELDNRSDDWWQHHGEKYVQVIKVMSINEQGYESALEEALNEDSKRWKWNV